MEALIDQYLEWKAGESEHGVEMDVDTHNFEVTSIYMSSESSLLFVRSSSYIYSGCIQCFLVMQKPNEPANVALLRNGLLGYWPMDLAVAISLETLELYHQL